MAPVSAESVAALLRQEGFHDAADLIEALMEIRNPKEGDPMNNETVNPEDWIANRSLWQRLVDWWDRDAEMEQLRETIDVLAVQLCSAEQKIERLEKLNAVLVEIPRWRPSNRDSDICNGCNLIRSHLDDCPVARYEEMRVWDLYPNLNAALRAAIQEFVDRCERGEVRSKYTYAKFKALLEASE